MLLITLGLDDCAHVCADAYRPYSQQIPQNMLFDCPMCLQRIKGSNLFVVAGCMHQVW